MDFFKENWKWLLTIAFGATGAWFALTSQVEAIDAKHEALAVSQIVLHEDVSNDLDEVHETLAEQEDTDQEVLIKLERIQTDIEYIKQLLENRNQ